MERQRGEAVAGAVAGVATTVALHPLDVIRTRFQVYDGRSASVPKYRGTAHALITIARSEGLRGLYAGLFPAIVASSLSWGVYFFFYSNAKHRYRDRTEAELGPGLHLLSAAEAGIIASAVTNPIWLVKTRLELQASGHKSHSPYKGFTDALQDIAKHEGWRGLYKGFGPSLLLVTGISWCPTIYGL